jgi:hypothetical protein
MHPMTGLRSAPGGVSGLLRDERGGGGTGTRRWRLEGKAERRPRSEPRRRGGRGGRRGILPVPAARARALWPPLRPGSRPEPPASQPSSPAPAASFDLAIARTPPADCDRAAASRPFGRLRRGVLAPPSHFAYDMLWNARRALRRATQRLTLRGYAGPRRPRQSDRSVCISSSTSLGARAALCCPMSTLTVCGTRHRDSYHRL